MSLIQNISKSQEIVDTFKSISRQVTRVNRRYEIDDSEILKLREHFTCKVFNRYPEVIYSETYLDFFYKYGYSNIMKNYYVLSELAALGFLSRNHRILDIGSGPGVFALALCLFKNENAKHLDYNYSVVLQDCSSEFLNLFRIIWKNLPIKNKCGIATSTLNELFVGQIPIEKGTPSILVLSNSLSEMLRDKRFNLSDFVNSLVETKPIIVIIDYGYDTLRNVFNRFISMIKPHFSETSLYAWPKWNKDFHEIDLQPLDYSLRANQHLSSNVRFIKSIYVPKGYADAIKPNFYTEIVLKYKSSWEKHDFKLLKELFTSDAIYIIDEKKPILFGMKSIERYWRKNKMVQTNVTFNPQYITFNSNIIHCEWNAIFFRLDLDKWLLLRGVFDAELQEEKIVSFKEKFSKELFETKPAIF